MLLSAVSGNGFTQLARLSEKPAQKGLKHWQPVLSQMITEPILAPWRLSCFKGLSGNASHAARLSEKPAQKGLKHWQRLRSLLRFIKKVKTNLFNKTLPP